LFQTASQSHPPWSAGGQRHHAGIVDQEIKGLPGVHPLREVGDRGEARQIEAFVTYLGAGRLALILSTADRPF